MANTHSLDLELSSSQYAYCNDNADVSITGDISGECWIKLETKASVVGVNVHLINKWTDQNDDRSYTFFIATDDTLHFAASDDGTWNANHRFQSHSSTTLTSTGVWVHVGFSFDISEEDCHFYINGVEEDDIVDDTPIGATMDDNISKFSIGCYFDGAGSADRFLDGKIDEVRLWSCVRTEAEFATNKDKELTGSEANLVGYWKLNNNYTDSCKSSDLTASGSPVFSTDLPFIGVEEKYAYFM